MSALRTENIVALLKRIHLFHGVSDDLLQGIAEDFQQEYYADGGKIFGVGDDGDKFYIVYKGKVALMYARSKHPQAVFTEGDYFGHEAIAKRRFRRAQASAAPGTILLALSAEKFLALYNSSIHFKKSIRLRLRTDELLRHIKFDWLRDDETVYMVATKHPLFLYQTLVAPFFLMIVAAMLILMYVISNSVIPFLLGLLVIFGALGWSVWLWIDWGNDYYIITSQRVVWIEKVLFLYDSRVETPFAMINSSDANTDFIGRWFDYGEVTIKTYTTRITFHHIPLPRQVASLIDELRGRARQETEMSEEEAMTEAIKRHLGLIPPPRPTVDESQETPPSSKPLSLPGLLLASLFQLRTVDGDAIVYRKHWFILLREAWEPTLLIFLTLGLITLDLLLNTPQHGMWTYFVLLLTVLVGLMGWWVYRFVDWRNDRFELSSEQIVDVDKKPLGDENRKTAKLEDILSIEYRREGLSGLIFNFGTVYIKVGTEVFTFDYVHNPTGVQQEIQQRRQERLLLVKENKIKAERDRMAKWMAIYHKSAKEIARLEDEKKDKLPPKNG